MSKIYTTKTASIRAIEADFDTLSVGDKGDIIKYIEERETPADEVIETYQDGSYWYRLYKSGWIEQGGTFLASSTASITVTLPKMMRNNTYYVHANYKNSSTNMYGQCFTLTTNSFVVKCYTGIEICWEVKGFAL